MERQLAGKKKNALATTISKWIVFFLIIIIIIAVANSALLICNISYSSAASGLSNPETEKLKKKD